MGPNKNVFWIVIRIALAFAMLIPGPMTGYNVIQDIVMKVVVEGVSLADQTWNFGLGYIKAGGTLWRRPETSGGGSGLISWNPQGKEILAPAQSVFNAEVCMVASSVINSNSANGSTGNGVVNSGSPKVTYNIVETKAGYAFPGLKNTSNFRTTVAENGAAANCGYISWENIPGYTGGQGSRMMAKGALSQLVYDIYPAAKKYVCANFPGAASSSACSGVTTDSLTSDNSQAVFNTLMNYVNAVYPLAQAQQSSANTSAENFIGDAMSEGWLMAGRYYWDLSRIQAHLKTVSDIGNYKAGPVIAGSNPAINYNSQLKSFVDGTSGAWSSYEDGAKNLLANYSKASGAGDTGGDSTTIDKSVGNKVLDVLLGGLISDIITLFALFGTHGSAAMGMGPNPIVFLHEVGMQCIQIAGYIWLDLAIAIFGLSAATMVCQSTLNLDTPLSAVSGWIKPPLMMLAAALLGVGVTLGYYVPLYPFMLFTFGVIGWIISVIEAMVAAPLIAFGLTHPEGHDFLGEAKQGLILLLGVFLRPVLMVIGLIAGMILSYVALRILVYTYSGFLQDIFYVAQPMPGASGSILEGAAIATGNVMAGGGIDAGSLIMSLFCFPLMLAVFASLVYVVTNQCFSLIYMLPDYILRWIGASPQSSSAAEMARQVQGAMGAMGDTSGKATNEGMSSKMRENQSSGNKQGNAPSKKKTQSEHKTK